MTDQWKAPKDDEEQHVGEHGAAAAAGIVDQQDALLSEMEDGVQDDDD
jgi:hypothetical protein